MSLTLRIENYDYLEDGGPVSHTVGPRGAQVGRGAGMDWVLPDPSRHISSHHFDIVAQDGSYWLTDVSTNGTFLVGQRYRLDGPHQLQPGDRFQVGPYIIAVEAAAGLAPQPGGADARPAIAPAPPGSWPSEEDPWAVGGGGLPPVDPLPPARIGRAEDFGDELIAPPTFAAPAPDPVGGAPISVPPALSRPDPSHAGSEPLPGASVLAPPSAEGLAGGAQVSMPPARPVSPPPEPEPGPPEPQA
ncbi:type VI secretion system-associated FHA domain protein, partial [Jannaschia aquimarina]